MKTLKISVAVLLFSLTMLIAASSAIAGAGNYGDPCSSDSDCKSDFLIMNLCCLDADFCGDMLNKCVSCNDDERCNQTIQAEGDWDIPEWMLYSCIGGFCYQNCRSIADCGVDEHAIACENEYCYQCNEDSDCTWKASRFNTGGICLNHVCRDCRSDDDCVAPPEDFVPEHLCQCNSCYPGGNFEDGDKTEDISGADADGASGEGDDDTEAGADGDGGAALTEDDGEASCSGVGGVGLLPLLLLVPAVQIRRRRA